MSAFSAYKKPGKEEFQKGSGNFEENCLQTAAGAGEVER
jgi:hypothetical protein